jgi:protein TonB
MAVRRNMVRALAISVALHFSVLGTYFLREYILSQDDDVPTVNVRIMRYSELGPPPSISGQTPPAVAIAGPSVRPSVGIPVPVPDAEISPEQTIATQQELSQVQNVFEGESGAGNGFAVEQDIQIDDESGIDAFIPVEKMPMPVKQVVPQYPEIARRSGIEGTVWLKILVDKEGNSRRAVVVRSDAEIFNDPAIQAGLQWKFTPAIMNRGPVAVWVVVPFRFRLSGAS